MANYYRFYLKGRDFLEAPKEKVDFEKNVVKAVDASFANSPLAGVLSVIVPLTSIKYIVEIPEQQSYIKEKEAKDAATQQEIKLADQAKEGKEKEKPLAVLG